MESPLGCLNTPINENMNPRGPKIQPMMVPTTGIQLMTNAINARTNPAAEPGTFSPEVWAAHEIYKLRLAQFDSVMSEIYQSLPWDADENEAAESR